MLQVKTKKNDTITTAVWIALVLAGATGLGYGIRHVRWSLAMRKNMTESKPQTQVADSEPYVETVQEPEPDIEIETADAETVGGEEPVWEEPEDESLPDVADESQSQQSQKPRNSGPANYGLGNWRSVWADLNLTEEEQARLREGWRIAVERWQNMSEQERQVQTERMRASWETWQNMSDVEKERASLDLRARIEEWRQSGSTELPDLILE